MYSYFQNLSLSLSFNEMTDEEATWPRNQKVVLTFDLVDKESWAVKVMNESLVFDFDMIRKRRPQNLLIYGAIIGYNYLEVILSLFHYYFMLEPYLFIV